MYFEVRKYFNVSYNNVIIMPSEGFSLLHILIYVYINKHYLVKYPLVYCVPLFNTLEFGSLEKIF